MAQAPSRAGSALDALVLAMAAGLIEWPEGKNTAFDEPLPGLGLDAPCW